jgi:competence protein ComEA
VAARVRELLADQGRTPVSTGRGDQRGPDAPDQPADGAAATGAWPGRASWRARLAARVPVRVDPGRRAALAVGAAVLVAAISTGVWLWSARPRAMAVTGAATPIAGLSTPAGTAAPPRGSPAPAPARPTTASPSATPVVVVDVAGKVRHPGLYRLPSGARVDDALDAAGGPLSGVDLNSLNLAARVVDGQQIAVGVAPAAGAPVPGPGVGGTAGAGAGDAGTGAVAGGPVDLNTASLEQLESLPGVGPVLGQHILDWRTAHGRFGSVAQLDDVPGIGTVKFAALRSLVTV